MPNHLRLIVVPQREDSLWKAPGRPHGRYAHCANARWGRTGLFRRNRFFSGMLDRDHLPAALLYVERNPVRPARTARAGGFPWSSARAHLIGRGEWADLPDSDPAAEQVERLAGRTHGGRLCGSAEFVRTAKEMLGRTLSKKNSGHPARRAAEGQLSIFVAVAADG
jgi:putative transposase